MTYGEKVIDHYQNPRNVGSLDENDPRVGTGIVGAPECGDVMKLQIRIDEHENIVDAKFKTFGCGSAIAASSLATVWIKGRKLDDALELRNTDIAKELALPPAKIHCSVLAEDVTPAAVNDLKRKLGKDQPAAEPRPGQTTAGRSPPPGGRGWRNEQMTPERKLDMDASPADAATPSARGRAKAASAGDGIRLTERAAQRVKVILEDQEHGATMYLYVGVKDGGCSGLQPVLDLRDERTAPLAETDLVFESQGIIVVCDLRSYVAGNMTGTTIDYQETLAASGFTFHNPNAVRTCSCGGSRST